jgi:hypothetical protein
VYNESRGGTELLSKQHFAKRINKEEKNFYAKRLKLNSPANLLFTFFHRLAGLHFSRFYVNVRTCTRNSGAVQNKFIPFNSKAVKNFSTFLHDPLQHMGICPLSIMHKSTTPSFAVRHVRRVVSASGMKPFRLEETQGSHYAQLEKGVQKNPGLMAGN